MKTSIKVFLIFCACLFIFPPPVISLENKDSLPDFDNYNIVKNLESEWLNPNQIVENQNSLKSRYSNNAGVKGFSLSFKSYDGLIFYLSIPKQTTLFINDRLIKKYKSDYKEIWPIDSLARHYSGDSLFIVVANQEKELEGFSSYIIKQDSASSVSGQQILERNATGGVRDYFIVGIILLLAGGAYLWNRHPKQFMGIYSIQGANAIRMRDQRLVNGVNLLFIGQHSLLIAFLLMLFQFYGAFFHIKILLFDFHSFGWFLLNWLLLSMIVYALIVLKYLFVHTMAYIFNFRTFGSVHIFEFLRLSLIFFGGLFFILMLIYMGYGSNIILFLNWSIILFYIFAFVRIIILLLNLLSGESFRNIYLFSYLCAAEIIPLFIGIKILLG